MERAHTSASTGAPTTSRRSTPDGRVAYVASTEVNRVTPIGIATNTAQESITVGENPSGIAITPNGKTAYVTDDEGVTPIDTATDKAEAPIAVGEGPDGIAITPDGSTAYVTNESGVTVTPIDLATNTAETPITVGSAPTAVAIAPDGKTAYVTNENDASVTPIDIATNKPETPIKVGENPQGIAITPNQPPVAAFSATSATLGQPTSFDASASVDPDGSLASYAWNFGDGSALVTGSPITSHTYTAPSSYTATLTLTDNEGCSTTLLFTGQTAFCSGSPGASTTRQVTVVAAPVAPNEIPAPNSSFSVLSRKVNKRTGAITFTAMVSNPGTFTGTLSFRNGKFGVFSAASKIACRKGYVRLKGRCRPVTVRFGSVRKTVVAAGTVVFTVFPSASATKALKRALEKREGLRVTALLSYRSAGGGRPVSRSVSIEDKLVKPRVR